MMRRAGPKLAWLACAAAPCAAWAADANSGQVQAVAGVPEQAPGIYLTAGLGETDNVGLSDTDKQSQTLASVGVLGDYERRGSLLDGSLKGSVDYFKYLQNAYSGQLVGRVDGLASLKIVPNHLKWLLQDGYGTTQVEVLGTQNPHNLQIVNVFSTGPDVELRPSEESFVRLGGRYEMATWQKTPSDNRRTLASLSIGEDVSLATSISLNANITKIKFQNALLNPDYDRRKFFAHYHTQGSRTDISLDLGVAQVDDTGAWRSNAFGQASVARDLTPFQSVHAAIARQYTDLSDSFGRFAPGGVGTLNTPGGGAGGNYLADSGNLGWRFNKGRTTIDLGYGTERDRYTLPPTPAQIAQALGAGLPVGLDITRWNVGGTVRRQLTPRVSADLHAIYTHDSYDSLNFGDHMVSGGIAVAYIASSRLRYGLQLDHSARTVDGTALVLAAQRLAGGYTENRVFLTAAYRVAE